MALTDPFIQNGEFLCKHCLFTVFHYYDMHYAID